MSGTRTALQRSEIKEALTNAGLRRVDDSILSKCVGLASTLSISAEQMAECWEAFSMNRKVEELTDHTFSSYKAQLIKDSELTGATLPPRTTRGETNVDGAVQTRPGLGKRHTSDGLNMVTPPAKRHDTRTTGSEQEVASSVDSIARGGAKGSPGTGVSATSPQLPPSTRTVPPIKKPKYSERTGVGEVVASLEAKTLPPAVQSTSLESRRSTTKCVISTSFPTNVTKPYRHMFSTIQDRAQALDNHLVSLGETIIQRHGIREQGDGTENSIAPLEAVNVPRQDKVCCVGRICNEAHDGRINSTSVVLEGARNTCGGARINVDLTHLKNNAPLKDYSLFPGQIVAIEGMNSTGRKLIAERICEGAAHPPMTTSIRQLRHFHYDLQDGAPVKVMTVCGPYTTSDNLEYEPLLDLLNNILETSPDVVILTGPFVDTGHEAVRNGHLKVEVETGNGMIEMITLSYEQFFANKIAGLIEELYTPDGGKENLHTQFVLVPGLEDATAQWVYPQAPFADRLSRSKLLDIPGGEGVESGTVGLTRIQEGVGSGGGQNGDSRVHCLSNPCTFSINETVIGITSTDVLFHISAEETNANLERGSRLKRISQHLLQQRSFYPLFPPPQSKPTNLDLKHMKQWQMPCQPDILIVPSKLTTFASTVLDSTVVVNPGHLTRGTTGGTYAFIEIHPFTRETLETEGGDDVLLPHRLNDRVRVEIKRI